MIAVVSGKYRMDPSAAAFFGATTMHIVVRDSEIAGRFGRHGSIHGALNANVAETTWQDVNREGWMKLDFSADYRTCVCRFGLRNGAMLGESLLTKIVRRNASPRFPHIVATG